MKYNYYAFNKSELSPWDYKVIVEAAFDNDGGVSDVEGKLTARIAVDDSVDFLATLWNRDNALFEMAYKGHYIFQEKVVDTDDNYDSEPCYPYGSFAGEN